MFKQSYIEGRVSEWCAFSFQVCGSSHGMLFCYCTCIHIHEYMRIFFIILESHMGHENSPVNCVLKNKSNCRVDWASLWIAKHELQLHFLGLAVSASKCWVANAKVHMWSTSISCMGAPSSYMYVYSSISKLRGTWCKLSTFRNWRGPVIAVRANQQNWRYIPISLWALANVLEKWSMHTFKELHLLGHYLLLQCQESNVYIRFDGQWWIAYSIITTTLHFYGQEGSCVFCHVETCEKSLWVEVQPHLTSVEEKKTFQQNF